jgi:hypothetical protein
MKNESHFIPMSRFSAFRSSLLEFLESVDLPRQSHVAAWKQLDVIPNYRAVITIQADCDIPETQNTPEQIHQEAVIDEDVKKRQALSKPHQHYGQFCCTILNQTTVHYLSLEFGIYRIQYPTNDIPLPVLPQSWKKEEEKEFNPNTETEEQYKVKINEMADYCEERFAWFLARDTQT